MKLLSWNVNGIRAAQKKGFLDWFAKERADLVCVQETKANREQLEAELINPSGYYSYFHSAKKPGYSGVATFSKKEPLQVIEGIGVPEIDAEGRVLITEFQDFFLVNAYFPNSQRDAARLDYKLGFCQEMLRFLDKLQTKGKNVILCGDLNIAHQEIDLKNPKSNEGNAGFLPEERNWMSEFLEAGYVDVFRRLEPGPGHYTWWSYRPGVRERNIGWRLDYHIVNADYWSRVKSARHQPKVIGSDHCPVELVLKD